MPSAPEHYGRKGQAQYGVDHYFSSEQIAVQAKNAQAFSIGEVLAEIGKTERFPNIIREYHVYVACDRSTDLANEIWRLSNARVANGSFAVKLAAWQDIEMQINSHPLLKEWYLGLPGVQGIVNDAVVRVQTSQYEAALPENVAKNLVSQYIPIEDAIDFLLRWDFSSNRVPLIWYERFWYVNDKLNDARMYCRAPRSSANDYVVNSFNLQNPGWISAYPYLEVFKSALDSFVTVIGSCTARYEFPDGQYMSLYGPWETPIIGASGNTKGWKDTAHQLAEFLFRHFYQGYKDYRGFGLYPPFRPE